MLNSIIPHHWSQMMRRRGGGDRGPCQYVCAPHIDPSSCADAFNIDVILIDELQTAVAAAPFGELIPVAVDAVQYLRFQALF